MNFAWSCVQGKNNENRWLNCQVIKDYQTVSIFNERYNDRMIFNISFIIQNLKLNATNKSNLDRLIKNLKISKQYVELNLKYRV